MKWIIIMLLLSVFAYAECIEPTDGMIISKSVTFCSSTYDIPNGITLTESDIILDCGTAVLRGNIGQSEIALRLENVDNVTVRNCNILTFNQGLLLKNVTNSLIEDNAILKNRIGIRLLDSYENTIRDNNDKSHQLAVSAINSKYNIVMIGNKNIERDFCETNACNEYRDMNVCESGDFYCSKKCSFETDADCTPPEIIEPETPKQTVDEFIEEAKKEIEENSISEPEEIVAEKTKLPLETKAIIYAILYIVTFIVFRIKKR